MAACNVVVAYCTCNLSMLGDLLVNPLNLCTSFLNGDVAVGRIIERVKAAERGAQYPDALNLNRWMACMTPAAPLRS